MPALASRDTIPPMLRLSYRIGALALMLALLIGLLAGRTASAHDCLDGEPCTEIAIFPAPLPGVITYTVTSGDTLWAIAARFELDVDSLRYANPDLMRNPDQLAVDQVLRIPPEIGAFYVVQPGDTLESIAQRWNVTPLAIQAHLLNRDGIDALAPGQELFLPGGFRSLDIAPPAASLQARFAWPLRGAFTQRFQSGHPAVDIAASYGTSVYAAAAGVVTRAGWLFTGYGYSVLIDHGDGWQTLYSHLKGPAVAVGERVSRGQRIGAVGSTGRSTGPHVHFEVRQRGVQVDPLLYLPALPPH